MFYLKKTLLIFECSGPLLVWAVVLSKFLHLDIIATSYCAHLVFVQVINYCAIALSLQIVLCICKFLLYILLSWMCFICIFALLFSAYFGSFVSFC